MTTTVAELAARDYQPIGYVLFIEGWDIAWTNRIELAGSGASSWIGEDHGARTVALGLEIPETIRLAIGLLESGLPVDDSATFTLVDRDSYFIAHAEDDEGAIVYERLSPLQDPAPSTLLGSDGSLVSIHGRQVNGEAIGSSGERRRFQVLPGDPLPGLDHAALNVEDGTAYLRPSAVHSTARWLEGRACALYLIRQDPDTGEWAPWDDQYTSGYSLIWWGTVRGVPQAQAGAWKMECEGPSSWLRKTLNTNRPAEWRPLTTALTPAIGEDKIAVDFHFNGWSNGTDTKQMAMSAYTASDTIAPSAFASRNLLAGAINSRLQTLAALAGPDGTFNTYVVNTSVAFTESGVTIRTSEHGLPVYPNPTAAVMQLRMHKSLWLFLGWDLVLQSVGMGICKSEYEVQTQDMVNTFLPLDGQAATNDPVNTGFWTAVFQTCPIGVDQMTVPDDLDGHGSARSYRPLYPSTVTVLQAEGQQTWNIGAGSGPYMESQLVKPPADKTLSGVSTNGGVCDACGFVVVRGTYKPSKDADETQLYQLAQVSWVDAGGAVASNDTTVQAVVWHERWLDPKKWGSKWGKLQKPWAASNLEFVPIALLGYSTDFADKAHRVLARLLLSTGTAEWSGPGPSAEITPGVNAHVDAGGSPANDFEISDLGLGIPQEMIDLVSFREAAEQTPGGAEGDLNKTRLAYIGPFDSQQTIEDILRPRGWCFSLKNGKYGLFQRAVAPTAENVEVAIGQADVAVGPDDGPPAEEIDFRPLEPIDLIRVSWGVSMLGDDGDPQERVIRARDPRASQRRGNAEVSIDGKSLYAKGKWGSEFDELWGDLLARWYAEPHAMVKVPVKGNVARAIWPGSIVSYTSPWPATRNGVYGMTNRVGRVVSVTRNLQTLASELEILIEAKDPTAQRRFAPVARLLDDVDTQEERHDEANRILYCHADAFNRGADTADVSAFEEPSWSTTGGDAFVYVWQSWDGLTWQNTAAFYVESVDAATNSITYKLGMSGQIYERRYALLMLAPYDDQDPGSWPQAVFGVTCDYDEKFGSGDLDGFRWEV